MSNARRRRNNARYQATDKGRATRDRYNASRRKTKAPTTAFRSYLVTDDRVSQATIIADRGSRNTGTDQ